MRLAGLQALVGAMVAAGVVELEARVEGAPVRVVRRAGDGAATLAPPPHGREAGQQPPPRPAPEASGQVITSPVAGRVLELLVGEGSTLRPRRPLCIIEAGGVASEIEAAMEGRVAAVLVEPGQAVEVGAALVRVEPI